MRVLISEVIDEQGVPEEMYNLLMNDNVSIVFIAAYIKKNEELLGIKLKGADAGAAHNLGAKNYKKLLDGTLSDRIEKRSKRIRMRSIKYQQSIKDALDGKIKLRKDS